MPGSRNWPRLPLAWRLKTTMAAPRIHSADLPGPHAVGDLTVVGDTGWPKPRG